MDVNIFKKKRRKWNNKGTTIFLSLMLGILCFVTAFAIAGPLAKVQIDNMAQLNCSTATDYQTKSVCTSLDMFTPLIVGTILGIGGFALGRMYL